MKCNSIHNQLIGYLDGEIDDDLRNKIEAHLKECDHCSEFLIRLKTAYDLIDEDKQLKYDPYMFTRLMGRMENRKPMIFKNKLQIAFQTIAFVAIIAIGIYSGILTGKSFSGESSVSADYQDEIYYLDELQHENMISVLLTDQIVQQ